MLLDEVIKAVGNPEYNDLLQALCNGLTRVQLEFKISLIKNWSMNDPRLSIERMNLIGGLRAHGFEVSGGRGGGKIYRILGYAEIEEKISSDRWTGKPRETLDWVHSLLLVTPDSANLIRTFLSFRDPLERLHENCFLYPFGYEGAKADLYLYREGASAALIIERFKTSPQLKVFCLHGSVDWYLNLACKLAPGSTRPVRLINLPPALTPDVKKLHPSGSFLTRTEAIYDLEDIAKYPHKYLNSRAMTTLRARERDTVFSEDYRPEPALEIIAKWQSYNEPKHRQLAITRDRIAVVTDSPGKIQYLGVRGGIPVAHHLFESLPNSPDTVSLMNEKALNYSAIEGGRPGLSDFNQIMSARALVEKGFRFEQSGGIDGGGVGLPTKKKKYACDFVNSYTFYTTFPISEFA
jgi:hypothetical protein